MILKQKPGPRTGGGSWALKCHTPQSCWALIRAVSDCALAPKAGSDPPSTFILHHHAQVSLVSKEQNMLTTKGSRQKSGCPAPRGLLDLVPQDQVLLVDLLHGKLVDLCRTRNHGWKQSLSVPTALAMPSTTASLGVKLTPLAPYQCMEQRGKWCSTVRRTRACLGAH